MNLKILDARRRQVETTRATVLFVDLRGYTRLAEQLVAELVVPLLDEFFAVVAAATEANAGQVFHTAGDSMMAGFGVNVRGAAGAREAVAASRAMLQRFAPIAARWQRELSVDTGIGVGIHLGDVAVGLLGPPGRQAPTLVGDTVNVAARLCSRARAGEVLFSSMVATELDAGADGPGFDGNTCLRLPKVALRGRVEPMDVWCVPAPARVAV
jgi:adenylate cyclase